MDALLLPLREEWYAIDVRAARRVVAGVRLHPLPGAPRTVLGVTNLRGEALPVLDLGLLLGLGPAGASHVVVAETARGRAGVGVGACPDTGRLETAAGRAETPGALGRFACGGRLVTALDVEDLLSLERIAAPAR